MSASVPEVRGRLLRCALDYPEAWEDHPWEESVVKVGKKVFVFFGVQPDLNENVVMTVKLPRSGDHVLHLPFAEPCGYGLGRHGWVTLSIPPADLPPVEELEEWIDESYRAVAPARLVRQLEAAGTG